MERDCPYCEQEIEFDTDAEEVVCPHCGKACEVDSEYLDNTSGWMYSLVPKSD